MTRARLGKAAIQPRLVAVPEFDNQSKINHWEIMFGSHRIGAVARQGPGWSAVVGQPGTTRRLGVFVTLRAAVDSIVEQHGR
jgi:hypothetical protein